MARRRSAGSGSTGASATARGAPEPAGTARLNALAARISGCRRCPRLAEYLAAAQRKYPEFWCGPVPGFGDPAARLVVVGLAPGMKGANRTGRMFTGDSSGQWLYRVLHATGFSPRDASERAGDGLALHDCYITAAARCAPPQNRPLPVELDACRPYLAEEVAQLNRRRVLLALGRIAHDAVIRIHGLRPAQATFAHGAQHELPDGVLLLDCYHCSRQNTNTGRLTWRMFEEVFRAARERVDRSGA